MQQNNGFEKVQSLLGELLNTARSNLHNNNMENRKATARCDVYNHKLSERREYLNSVVESLRAEKATVEEAERNAGDSVRVRTELSEVYSNLAKSEQARFENEKSFYSGLKNTVNEALNSVSEISSQLKSSNEPTEAFLQTSIKKITDSYHKVFNMKIELPATFIQMSIDNDAARRRILEWLEDIKGTFASMVSSVDEDDHSRSESNGRYTALLDKVVEALGVENQNISELQSKYHSLAESYDTNVASFADFQARNEENLKENEEYCAAEAAAFARVQANSESNVKIYEELMEYFLENYRKISKMINDKYRSLE